MQLRPAPWLTWEGGWVHLLLAPVFMNIPEEEKSISYPGMWPFL